LAFHSSSNSRGAGGINAPSASAGLDNVDRVVAISNTQTLSSRTVNETRAQYAFGDLKAPPTDPVGPAVSIAGVSDLPTMLGWDFTKSGSSRESNSVAYWREHGAKLSDTVTMLVARASHAAKVPPAEAAPATVAAPAAA